MVNSGTGHCGTLLCTGVLVVSFLQFLCHWDFAFIKLLLDKKMLQHVSGGTCEWGYM